MSTVAVTGASGGLGRALLGLLGGDDRVERVLAVDSSEPDMPGPKLDFRLTGDRDPLPAADLAAADALVHLALADPPPRAAATSDEVDAAGLHGLRALLATVGRAGVRKLVVCSGAAVYGAHPDNDVPLLESSALRANVDVPGAYRLLLAEELLHEWARAHPDVTITILRPAAMPLADQDGQLLRHLLAPRLLTIRGYEPPMQFVHVDDVATAVQLALSTDLSGAHNVAADGWLTLGETAQLLGRRTMGLPEALAFSGSWWLWRRGWRQATPGSLHYWMFPWVVSCERLREHGWAPQWSNQEVLRQLSVSRGDCLALGRRWVRRRDLRGAAVVTVGLAAGSIAALRTRAHDRTADDG